PKWIAYFRAAGTFNNPTVAISCGGLIVIMVIRRVAPRLPGALIAVILAAAAVSLLSLDKTGGVQTIGTRFGGIPRTLPHPSFPVALHNWTDISAAFAKGKAL